MQETQQKKSNRYITGFDGVRTLAVVGVILYHLLPTKMKGGYLGVPIFFGLSGYLITDSLRKEWVETGKIALGKFFGRRMKRLYPGLLVLMVVSTAYITIFQPNLLNNLRGMFASCVLYYNNWFQIHSGMSYFERFANPSPFTHIWYLAVEFQNYLIWPILFGLMMKFVKNRKYIFYFVLAVSVASAIWMAILFDPSGDPTRVYYGTDTRLFSIWLGSALAFIWPTNHLKEQIPLQAKRLLNISGIVSFLLLAVAFVLMDASYDFIYYGGFFLTSLLSIILIAVVAHPGASLNKWLSNPLFSFIGKRSYGIYLYQYPVMIFYESKVKNIANNLWLHTLIEIVIILILSELSYRFVEMPLKNFDYGATWSKLKEAVSGPWKSPKRIGQGVVLAVLAVCVFGLATAPVNHVDAQQKQMQEQIKANKKIAAESQKKAKEKAAEEPKEEPKEIVLTEAQKADMATYGLTEEQMKKAASLKFTAFGDSVMLGAAEGLKEVFTSAVVDADISRQVYTSADLLKKLKDEKLLYDTVVIGLGTNGMFNTSQFDDIMKIMGDRQVYWVNVLAPNERYQGDVNQMLANMAKKYKNLQIIDWYDYGRNHPEWFYEDSIHVNPDGLVGYTQLLVDTLVK